MLLGVCCWGCQNTSAATAKKFAAAAVNRVAAGVAVGSGKGAVGEERGWVGVQVVLLMLLLLRKVMQVPLLNRVV